MKNISAIFFAIIIICVLPVASEGSNTRLIDPPPVAIPPGLTKDEIQRKYDEIVAFFDDVDHQAGCLLGIFHLFGLQAPLLIRQYGIPPEGD